MSLDGYVAGPNQSIENPLGEGGDHLHDWLFKLKTFRAIHGDMSGGETGINDDVLRQPFENVGATLMGRNMFGGGHDPWVKNHPWQGWWHDILFRHRRHRVGTEAGQARSEWQRCGAGRRT